MFLCLPACLESCCFTFSNIIIWLRADSHVEIACSTRKAITCQSAWGDHHSPAPATGDIEGGPGHEITWIGHKEWLCHAQAGTKEHQPRASTQSFSSKCRKRRKKNIWISPIRRTLPTIVFFFSLFVFLFDRFCLVVLLMLLFVWLQSHYACEFIRNNGQANAATAIQIREAGSPEYWRERVQRKRQQRSWSPATLTRSTFDREKRGRMLSFAFRASATLLLLIHVNMVFSYSFFYLFYLCFDLRLSIIPKYGVMDMQAAEKKKKRQKRLNST